MRNPDVAVEIETYRPFFIQGAVKSAGQFAYVYGMTVRAAISTAGGYSETADRSRATDLSPAGQADGQGYGLARFPDLSERHDRRGRALVLDQRASTYRPRSRFITAYRAFISRCAIGQSSRFCLIARRRPVAARRTGSSNRPRAVTGTTLL